MWLIATNPHWSLSYGKWVMAVNEQGEFFLYAFLCFPPCAYITVGCHFHAWRDIEGTSLVVRWLRLCAPNGEGLGSIPGQGTRQCLPQLKAPSRCSEDHRSHLPPLRLSIPFARQNQTSSEGCKIFLHFVSKRDRLDGRLLIILTQYLSCFMWSFICWEISVGLTAGHHRDPTGVSCNVPSVHAPCTTF